MENEIKERDGIPDLDGMAQDRQEQYRENAHRLQMKVKEKISDDLKIRIDQEIYQTIQSLQLVREQMSRLFELSKKQ